MLQTTTRCDEILAQMPKQERDVPFAHQSCAVDLSLGQFWSDKAVTVQSGLCPGVRGLSVMLRGSLSVLPVTVENC